MARKNRVVRRVDERNDNLRTGGGDLIQIGSDIPTAPGIIQPPEPNNVVIGTQVLLRTTYTPKVAVNVSWGAPANLLPEFYLIEFAESSDFLTNAIRVTTSLNKIALEMKPATDYWVRVKAMIRGMYSDWAYPTNYPSVSVTTIGDTIPPGPLTAINTNWTTADLSIRWTNPTSSNFFQTRVRIYDHVGGTLYKEVFIVGNPGSNSQYIFTLVENENVTSGAYLKSVYYELQAFSLAGIPAVTSQTNTVTKAPPAKPTGLSSSWSSDDGTYDEGVTIAWNNVAGVKDYRIIIDGVEKFTPAVQYVYGYTENVRDHRPTLVSGDQSLAFTVQARDPLNQLSPGASGTGTNLAPQSSNLSLAVVPGFSSLYAYVAPTNEILDLYAYRWTLKSGGVNVRSVVSFTPEVTFTTLKGSYVLEVYAVDKFGQKSTTISGAAVLDGLTIEELRADLKYTSSDGQSQAALDALKDGLFISATSHAASASAWRWIKGERALLDRYRTITFWTGGVTGTLKVYFGISSDDVTYRWFAGPLVSTGAIAGNTTFTEYASEALAQTNALTAASATQYRFDLPAILEARYIMLGHRNTTNSYVLREFYPRRLLQSDDMEAETIKGINIAASAIIADHISVTQLSAITANIGQLVIDTTGYIWQGTGTAATPTTGLKIDQSGGIGRLRTFNGGTVQISLDTDGKLKWAAGNGILDASGMTFIEGASDVNSIRWLDGSATIGQIYADRASAPTPDRNDFIIRGQTAVSGDDTHLELSVTNTAENKSAIVYLNTTGGSGASGIGFSIDNTTRMDISSSGAFVTGNIDGTTIGDIGSWTPVLKGSTIAGTFTYSVQVGRYYKFGKLIFAMGRIDITAIGTSPTGQFRVGGLPFTALNASAIGTVNVGYLNQFNLATAGAFLQGLPLNNSTDIIFYENADNVTANLASATGINATFAIIFTAIYVAA